MTDPQRPGALALLLGAFTFRPTVYRRLGGIDGPPPSTLTVGLVVAIGWCLLVGVQGLGMARHLDNFLNDELPAVLAEMPVQVADGALVEPLSPAWQRDLGGAVIAWDPEGTLEFGPQGGIRVRPDGVVIELGGAARRGIDTDGAGPSCSSSWPVPGPAAPLASHAFGLWNPQSEVTIGPLEAASFLEEGRSGVLSPDRLALAMKLAAFEQLSTVVQLVWIPFVMLLLGVRWRLWVVAFLPLQMAGALLTVLGVAPPTALLCGAALAWLFLPLALTRRRAAT